MVMRRAPPAPPLSPILALDKREVMVEERVEQLPMKERIKLHETEMM